MKTFTSVLLFLAASASMVAAAPSPVVTPAPLYPRQNAAGNDGSKGIEAADIAQEAVDLANAGDIGALTSGSVFSSVNAVDAAKSAADVKTAADVVATEAASAKNNKGNDNKGSKAKAGAGKAKAAKKGKGKKAKGKKAKKD